MTAALSILASVLLYFGLDQRRKNQKAVNEGRGLRATNTALAGILIGLGVVCLIAAGATVG